MFCMQLSHDWCLLVFAQPAPGLSLTIQYFICYFNSVALLITFTWFYIPLVYIPQLLKALIPLHPGNPAAGYSQLWAVWFSNVVDFEYKICSKGNKSKSVGLHFIIINSLHKECSAFFISLLNSLLKVEWDTLKWRASLRKPYLSQEISSGSIEN